MKVNKTGLITIITLLTVAVAPQAIAQIYKCDGPNGPVYSDRECGPNAEDVKLRDSSGLSGVTDADKKALAEKKQEREQAQAQSRKQQGNTVNNQFNNYATESPGRWVRGRNRPLDRDRPVNLPARPRPATPRIKR